MDSFSYGGLNKEINQNPGITIGRIFGPEYLLRLFLAGEMSGSVFYLVHHALLAKLLMLIVPDKQDIYTLLKQMLSSSFLSATSI
ncbi:hypothetical protein ERO13_A07G149500v2 [Gossypium hirsutum]|nr:hypothetical protein ERO13_A07G149500v2 [Gossypium hirsutum]KAG4192319.1 hypothetical protein ERO13_A07G149500v2 [Gossypium hirsutum]KAG4192320.1 hypothetical protein ERO13_A07G149500v2 [Gossypium hirsutum]